MAGTVLFALSALSPSFTITWRDVCRFHFADEETDIKEVMLLVQGHMIVASAFRPGSAWKIMIILCFKSTMFQE